MRLSRPVFPPAMCYNADMTKFRIFATYLLALAVGAALGLTVAYALQQGLAGPVSLGPLTNSAIDSLPPEFDRLGEAWDFLQREHIEREGLDAGQLSDGAIRGMMQAMDDPYASFLNVQQFELESEEVRGFFGGIGAQVGMREGRLTIIAPLPDTPAEQAGIRPGDVILEIDGESASGLTLQEAVSRIRGEQGTTVELLVLHLNRPEPAVIAITRGVIPLETVRFAMRPDGIGHLQISSFANNTNEQVTAALQEFRAANGVGLIVDLRNNPGGLLRAVVDVTSQFLGEGLVAYELNGQGERRDWKATGEGAARDIPMVVLVNQFSASASEVFAGAIIDHNRAPVIGVTSFGKGSVNTMRGLSDGSGIFFTIARWYTPKGTLIEGAGINPTFTVEAPPDAATDVQLERALEYLQQRLVGATAAGRPFYAQGG